MKLAYDRAAKETLLVALEGVSLDLSPEREVAPDAQRLDLWCEPDPARVSELEPLGVVKRIAEEGPCAFEFFHKAPTLGDVLESLRKVLALRRPALIPPRPSEPWLWVIAGGRPEHALSALGFAPGSAWPRGFYDTVPGLRMRVVVTNELPTTPDTLLLRALGAGKTLRQAQREIRALGFEHPVSRIVAPILLRLHLEQKDQPLSPLDQEFQMETRDLYQEWHQKIFAEGEARGEALGEARALLRVLQLRGHSVSAEQAARIKECRDVAQLERWLERALSAGSTAEVLR